MPVLYLKLPVKSTTPDVSISILLATNPVTCALLIVPVPSKIILDVPVIIDEVAATVKLLV